MAGYRSLLFMDIKALQKHLYISAKLSLLENLRILSVLPPVSVDLQQTKKLNFSS